MNGQKPTIIEVLQRRKQDRLARLIELKAPEGVINWEKQGLENGPVGENLEKYGHLKVNQVRDLKIDDEDPGLFPALLFSCENMHEILMFTRFPPDEKQLFIPGEGWKCETVFERLAVTY